MVVVEVFFMLFYYLANHIIIFGILCNNFNDFIDINQINVFEIKEIILNCIDDIKKIFLWFSIPLSLFFNNIYVDERIRYLCENVIDNEYDDIIIDIIHDLLYLQNSLNINKLYRLCDIDEEIIISNSILF